MQLKETIISSAISELGVSVEAFCAAAEVRIKGKDSQACKLLDLILYLDDFEVKVCLMGVVLAGSIPVVCQAFAKLMRKRLGELANNGPFGAAPVASMSSSAGGRASRSDGGASAGEMSSTPMYMWDPSWHQYVQLAQGIVRASFTGHLADGEKVSVSMCPVVLVCE